MIKKRGLRILQVSTGDKAKGGAEGSALGLHYAYQQRGLDSWLAVGSKTRNDPSILQIQNEVNRSAWTRCSRSAQTKLANKNRTLSRVAGKLAWIGELKRVYDRELGVEDFHYPGTWKLLELPPDRPNLLHCHNLHSDYFDLNALPWLSSQIPVILNLRDEWFLTGHCCCSLGCERWKFGCGSCPDLTIYPAIKRDSSAYNWARKKGIYDISRLYVTAPSQWLLDRASTVMFPSVRRRVIKNAIDLEIFRPQKREVARQRLNLPIDADIVLLMAHSDFKDFYTMEATLAKINKQDGRELLFLCLGKEGIGASLGQGQIRYLGFEWDRERLANYYQSADVFIHVSLGESFGKAITEAMACGIPVVTTAIGGIPEQMINGSTGFLLEELSGPNKLAEAVKIILNNYELKSKMGEAATLHAHKEYGLERQVSAFLAWYEEVREDWLFWKNDVR